jgi:hypothetical protein
MIFVCSVFFCCKKVVFMVMTLIIIMPNLTLNATFEIELKTAIAEYTERLHACLAPSSSN